MQEGSVGVIGVGYFKYWIKLKFSQIYETK